MGKKRTRFCRNCLHWVPGICKRFPPMMVEDTGCDPFIRAMQPEVLQDGWCGEWKKRSRIGGGP